MACGPACRRRGAPGVLWYIRRVLTIRRHFHRLTWLALLAVLALALAPTVSRALSAAAGFDAQAALCSAGGAAPQGSAGATPDGHCPLCGPGSTDMLAPPAADGVTAWRVVQPCTPRASAPAPSARFAWVSAPPRAPPAAA